MWAAACCTVLAASECQQLGKSICLIKVRSPGKDRAQHYKEIWLEYSERKEWKEKGPNSEIGKAYKSIDRKRQFAGRDKDIYNGKEEGSFMEEGIQSV